MEELSNLIWIGGVIAEKGPLGFQRLWAVMHRFLAHYVYGVTESSREERNAGHNALQKYAELLDDHVYNGEVSAPTQSLQPMTLLCPASLLPHSLCTNMSTGSKQHAETQPSRSRVYAVVPGRDVWPSSSVFGAVHGEVCAEDAPPTSQH